MRPVAYLAFMNCKPITRHDLSPTERTARFLNQRRSVMIAPDFETNWGSASNPATVTVPAWFTLGAARKVAAAKGVQEVAFYDQKGSRTTLALAGLMGIPPSRLLANCHPPQDLQTSQAA